MHFDTMEKLIIALGFIITPRITLMALFYFYYIQCRFVNAIFLPISIWWAFPATAIGFFGKLGFSLGFIALPRTLLGILGCIIFDQNIVSMIIITTIGLAIDIAVKIFSILSN